MNEKRPKNPLIWFIQEINTLRGLAQNAGAKGDHVKEKEFQEQADKLWDDNSSLHDDFNKHEEMVKKLQK